MGHFPCCPECGAHGYEAIKPQSSRLPIWISHKRLTVGLIAGSIRDRQGTHQIPCGALEGGCSGSVPCLLMCWWQHMGSAIHWCRHDFMLPLSCECCMQNGQDLWVCSTWSSCKHGRSLNGASLLVWAACCRLCVLKRHRWDFCSSACHVHTPSMSHAPFIWRPDCQARPSLGSGVSVVLWGIMECMADCPPSRTCPFKRSTMSGSGGTH